jgi:hypothetical protein
LGFHPKEFHVTIARYLPLHGFDPVVRPFDRAQANRVAVPGKKLQVTFLRFAIVFRILIAEAPPLLAILS